MKKRFSDQQIISIIREAEAGASARELCLKHAISDATFYIWRKKYGGMVVTEVKRLNSLEDENVRLKKLLAKAVVSMCDATGLWQRRACRLTGFFLSTCRYEA